MATVLVAVTPSVTVVAFRTVPVVVTGNAHRTVETMGDPVHVAVPLLTVADVGAVVMEVPTLLKIKWVPVAIAFVPVR